MHKQRMLYRDAATISIGLGVLFSKKQPEGFIEAMADNDYESALAKL